MLFSPILLIPICLVERFIILAQCIGPCTRMRFNVPAAGSATVIGEMVHCRVAVSNHRGIQNISSEELFKHVSYASETWLIRREMVHRIAFGCSHNSSDIARGVSFFRLPLRKPDLLKSWLAKLRLWTAYILLISMSCRTRHHTCTMELKNSHTTAFTLDPSHNYVVYTTV